MRCDLLSEHVKEKFHLPEEWFPYSFDCLPHGKEAFYVEMKGAIAPMKPDGKDPIFGRDWKKQEKGTKQTLQLGIHEHEQWLLTWEQKNDKCHECVGSGKIMASCGRDGTTYRECSRCKGTGKAPKPTP